MFHTTRQHTLAQEKSRMGPWTLPETTNEWYATPPSLAGLAEGFSPISLKEMDSAALLNRIDTKFAMSTSQMLSVLPVLRQDYRILSVHGQRLNHYRTLYFDTPDFELYLRHVNGYAERYKVRTREYTDSGLAFLEVKHKTRKGRTIKERISTALPLVKMNLEAENWLQDIFPYNTQELEPKIWNTFTRVTLVGKQHCERVTLDLDLNFFTTGKSAQVDGIVIAESKRDSENGSSPFLAQMRARKIHPQGFSKYCIGISMLYDQVKKNNLKPKLLWIEKMTGGLAFND